MASLNVEQIRQYNSSLQVYKDQAAKLSAEIEVNNQTLQRLCDELTKLLGEPVTMENIEAIYQKKVEEINSLVAQGSEVIRRIREEEQMVKSGANEKVKGATGGLPVGGISGVPSGTPVSMIGGGGASTPPSMPGYSSTGLNTGDGIVGGAISQPPIPPTPVVGSTGFTGFDSIGDSDEIGSMLGSISI